jgi:hypothetical protein
MMAHVAESSVKAARILWPRHAYKQSVAPRAHDRFKRVDDRSLNREGDGAATLRRFDPAAVDSLVRHRFEVVAGSWQLT